MIAKILVLEDVEEIRELLREGLSEIVNPSQILEALNPLDALEIYHKYKDNIAFVVCDQLMPLENGIEFCKIVKNDNPETVVLIFSGAISTISESMRVYADTFISKDEGIDAVIRYVKKHPRFI